MKPREFDERTSGQEAKPPWWRFGCLRVRLRFAGMEVDDRPKHPRELIGKVIPWGAVQYGQFAAYTAIFGEDSEPIRAEGRRWFATVGDTREVRAASRLYTRWVRRQVANGQTVDGRYAAQRGVRWIVWPAGAGVFIGVSHLVLNGNLGWLHGQSIAIVLLTVLTLAGFVLLYGLIIVGAFWFGWKIGQPAAEKLRLDARGFTATMSDGVEHSVNWSEVRSVCERGGVRSVRTHGGLSINMGTGCRAWRAIWPLYVTADGSEREAQPTNTQRRDRPDAKTYRRILGWFCGGMFIAFAIGAWAGAAGLLPHPWWLSGVLAAGQLGVLPAAAVILQHWPSAWFRRQMKRVKRRRRGSHVST